MIQVVYSGMLMFLKKTALEIINIKQSYVIGLQLLNPLIKSVSNNPGL